MKTRLGNRGAALVLVLLVTAAMTAMIAEIIAAVHGQASRTSNFIEGQKAALAAEGGFELGVKYLSSLGGSYTHLPQNGFTMPVDGMLLEVIFEDESGKFLANSIVYPNGEVNEAAKASYESILSSAGMDAALSGTLADWLDLDDSERPDGAEAPYYNRLGDPYAPKNGRLDTVGELSLVKGYGRAAAERLVGFLTVYSDGLVNINTAPGEVIMALSEEITPEMAGKLMERRQERPFADASEIRSVKGFEMLVFSLQGRIKVKSDIFRIRSRATSEGAVREVEAVVRTGKNGKVLYWRAR